MGVLCNLALDIGGSMRSIIAKGIPGQLGIAYSLSVIIDETYGGLFDLALPHILSFGMIVLVLSRPLLLNL